MVSYYSIRLNQFYWYLYYSIITHYAIMTLLFILYCIALIPAVYGVHQMIKIPAIQSFIQRFMIRFFIGINRFQPQRDVTPQIEILSTVPSSTHLNQLTHLKPLLPCIDTLYSYIICFINLRLCFIQ